MKKIIVAGAIVLAVGLGAWYWYAYYPVTSSLTYQAEPTRPADWRYLDASLSIDERVEDLLSRMTQAEKIGQMALIEKNSISDSTDISRYGLGGLLSGAGARPDPNTPAGWQDMVKNFDTYSRRSRLGIPILYGVDANHGHGNVPGATLFPHFIGLGATHDPELVKKIASATAKEIAATGVTWSFSPTLDVATDPRWGRAYETFGSDTANVTDLGVAYMRGLQEAASPVLAAAKHYVGNGDMEWGTSINKNFKIDQGVTRIDERTLRATHLPPFKAAVQNGALSVMAGLNTWQDKKLSANSYLLTDVLKKELGFKGFVVSDWYGVYEISPSPYRSLTTAVNAGVDMVMLPFDYKSFSLYMNLAVDRGDISRERLDDAVRRILRAKFAVGLFDRRPGGDLSTLNSPDHRALAREAVAKSQVLLKNRYQTLPLSKKTKRIVVAGSSADNIGRQNGAWTIEWQGVDGNWFGGTSILGGIREAVSGDTVVEYEKSGTIVNNPQAEIGIAVVGEAPYAEGWGDAAHPELSKEDIAAIKKLRSISRRLVVVIVSGRPVDISAISGDADAIVASWLPGSEGAGVADVLFGDQPFTGRLPMAWPL